MKRATLTITQASELLGISRNSAYEQARTGQLAGVPVIRVGRRLLIPAALLRSALGLDGREEIASQPTKQGTDNDPPANGA